VVLYLKELDYSILELLLVYILFKKLFFSFEVFIFRKYKEFVKDIKNINII
jgi:hypothetical protein